MKKFPKKLICLLSAISLFIGNVPLAASAAELYSGNESTAWPDGPSVEADGAYVIEANTGAVLYEKNATEAFYPASITKIMTAILVLENCELDDIVTFSHDATHKVGFIHGDSSIARDEGEMMTVEQTLYGMMLQSANECAYALAEHVSGSIEAFADLMNEKAKEIGCVNTHFANPHGLHDPEHYTCAHDMAVIAKYAYQNDEFMKIVGTKTYTIPPTNKHAEETNLCHNHQMVFPLYTAKYLYDGVIGGKSGFTDEARSTLVTYAERDGMVLIVVLMHTVSSSAQNYYDTKDLFNCYFDNCKVLSVADNETGIFTDISTGVFSESLQLFDVDPKGGIVLPKTVEFKDADSSISYDTSGEDVIATLNYTYAGKNIGHADITLHGVDARTFDFSATGSLNDTGVIAAPEAAEVTEDTENAAPVQKDRVFLNVRHVVMFVSLALLVIVLIILAIKFLPDFLYRLRRKWNDRDRGPQYTVIRNSYKSAGRRQDRRKRKRDRIRKSGGPKVFR